MGLPVPAVVPGGYRDGFWFFRWSESTFQIPKHENIPQFLTDTSKGKKVLKNDLR